MAGNAELHTLMELAATLLAINIGIIALIRFYRQQDNTFLFIGSGFLGTGFLDGYHAVVTSSHFASLFPSAPASLIPWSWLASRLLLSFALCLSWWFWKREERLGVAGIADEKVVYGHPVGDLLLQAVAQRLRMNFRETDTIERFGGDEFALIGTDIREPADAAVIGDKLPIMASKPFSIEGKEIHCGISVGIDVYGHEAPDAESLLSHADIALYRAKTEGRGTYRFFTQTMDEEVRKRVSLGAELRVAIESSQLFLLYQPQVDVGTRRIVGLEALVRWNHPERGEDGLSYPSRQGPRSRCWADHRAPNGRGVWTPDQLRR